MYDYDADDDDEVSFRDGDVIVDCKSIDDGWMMGTVLRTVFILIKSFLTRHIF